MDEYFDLLYDAFGAKSIHILVDGLDGFVETKTSKSLMMWIEPLLKVVERWDENNIYLKLFLPMDISDASDITKVHLLRTATLEWDDNLLAEVIRRRVYVASGGDFDSLDAISAPEVRNVELTLARQLGETQKLPRQMILKSRNLLKRITESKREWITPEDLHLGEPPYVAII